MGIPAATQQEQYLELSCNLAELKKIKECIFQIACKSNQEINKKIYLACEEIFVNIVSYSGADHARFFCSRNADKITVNFDEGGMGIMLVKELCSAISYSNADGKNNLRMEFTDH